MKKRNVQFLVLFLLLAAFLCLFSGKRMKAEDGIKTEKDYENQMQLQRFAVAASGVLTGSFEQDEVGNYIYPDTLCGIWIEGAKLIIALTADDQNTIAYYDTILGDYKQYVEYVTRTYSKNQLYGLIDYIAESIEQQYNEPIQSYEVKEKENRIEIGVSEALLNRIKNDGLKFDEYPVTLVKGITTETATTALKGGMAISNVNAGCAMTLSVCGKYNGGSVLVTCGHGGQTVGDVIKYSGAQIGQTTYVRYTNYGYGDFSFVPIMSGSFSGSNQILSYYISGCQSPSVGTTVKFYGKTTASVGYGTVVSTGVQVYADSSVYLKGMTKIHVYSGNIQNGDSGGPFFCLSGSTVIYCGVLHGRRVTEESELMGYFTPYQYLSTAGFSLN